MNPTELKSSWIDLSSKNEFSYLRPWTYSSIQRYTIKRINFPKLILKMRENSCTRRVCKSDSNLQIQFMSSEPILTSPQFILRIEILELDFSILNITSGEYQRRIQYFMIIVYLPEHYIVIKQCNTYRVRQWSKSNHLP